MEPRKDQSTKKPEPRKDEPMRRLQIEKLEERIAPRNCGGDGHGNHRCPRG